MSVVTRFVDAANHHDAEGVAACVHREFQSVQPFHPGRNFRGPGQLRSNWQAIFDSEPGFRLTVLRSAIAGDTVWVELHGAGEEAEVAGVFIVGVEGGRVRWIRVYSELVDEVAPEEEVEEADHGGAAEGVGEDGDERDEVSPLPLRLVRDEPETPGEGEQAAQGEQAEQGEEAEHGEEGEEAQRTVDAIPAEPAGVEATGPVVTADEPAPAPAVVTADEPEPPVAPDQAAPADTTEPVASTGEETSPDSAQPEKRKRKSALRAMFGRTKD